MVALMRMHWLHYQPARPSATLWDEWMVAPTLWPGTNTEIRTGKFRSQWRQTLLGRHIDPRGYVASHQHASLGHPHGWPFPFWKQGGTGTWGWHFSLQGAPTIWHKIRERSQDGWQLLGGVDHGIEDDAWRIRLRQPAASAETPPLHITPRQAPFIQLRWRAEGLAAAQPYLQWRTRKQSDYTPQCRIYFAPPDNPHDVTHTIIPVHESPAWKGHITHLRLCFDNPPGAEVGIQALFTQYDTRHNVNNQAFIIGSENYFAWTRDLDFLRQNINRMRLALRYIDTRLGGRANNCVLTPFVGHDGRSAITVDANGHKQIVAGRGIANNYWDLLPMGHKDAYATMRYYHALNRMARLETAINRHPEWNIPDSPLRQAPADLREHAQQVKRTGNEIFWNKTTGRFVCAIDVDGQAHDYGFTFLNCDAIHYGFATPAHTRDIMSWLTGERTVPGDTAQGKDIYHWRFGPRATTRRNTAYYSFCWPAPEKIPWGAQVQDGGAVLGFSYHDLMARIRVLGPDQAWARLRRIIDWFRQVQAAGGYRAYYKDGTRGTLQGGGEAGGLGCDKEFLESILVPNVVIDGFLGLRPRCDGFEIRPRLPADWPALTVTRIRLHRHLLDITADGKNIIVKPLKVDGRPLQVYLPPGSWRVERIDRNDEVIDVKRTRMTPTRTSVPVALRRGIRVRFTPG
jgi:hypothetical protein